MRSFLLEGLVAIMEEISMGIHVFVPIAQNEVPCQIFRVRAYQASIKADKPWFFPFYFPYHYAKENEIVMGCGYIYKYCVTADVARCGVCMSFVHSNSLQEGKKGGNRRIMYSDACFVYEVYEVLEEGEEDNRQWKQMRKRPLENHSAGHD